MGRTIKEGAQIVMMEYLNWFFKTCTLVGVPVTLWLVAYVAKQGFFIGSCNLTGYYCEANTTGERVEVAMSELLETFPDHDVSMKPRNKH